VAQPTEPSVGWVARRRATLTHPTLGSYMTALPLSGEEC
jgi:hypothetical protein